jgi:cation diffusion facilitator family transporter
MDTSSPAQTQVKRSSTIVNVGLVANILLAALKSFVGIFGHSPALLADGVNSTSDVVYFIVVKIYMKIASHPADEDHPYGHKQFESIAAIVVGAFVLTTAVAIFWDSVNKVFDIVSGRMEYTPASWAALLVAVCTVALKIMLASATYSIGKRANNQVVMAIAYDHRNDIFAAIAVTIGILVGELGLRYFDPLAGALVAIVILRTGIKILRDSAADLMATSPNKQIYDGIRRIAGSTEGVEGIEEIHAHRYGPYMVINITIIVEGTISVIEGDRIATVVERALRDEYELIRKVNVHFHPRKELRKA